MTDTTPNLPTYNFEGLLKLAGFASIGMLKSERRQLAEQQQPIGQYWSGHAWVLLYRAADAVDVPPLSPGRQRLYDKNRTCAMCGTKRTDPFPKGRDGERYCGKCQRPAGERLWRRERDDDRPEIIAWARGVLADPTVVLAAQDRHPLWTRDLVIALDGTVLLDAEIRHNFQEPYEEHPERDALLIRSPAAVVDKVEQLRGRRLIAWWPTTAPRLATSWDTHGWSIEQAAIVGKDDVLGRWYDRWIGEIADERGYLSEHPRLKNHQPPGTDAEESIVCMRAILAEIASGKHQVATGSNPAGGEGR